MKISMCGSFSTGKTTLVRSLADTLIHDHKKDTVIIEETARRVIAAGYPLDRHATLEAYFLYVFFQLEAERNAASHQVVVSDRSLLDSLAYLNVNGDSQFPDSFVKMLTEIVWKETQYFDVYCYLPIEFSPVDDGIRSIDHDYQHLVDTEMLRLLEYFRVPIVKVGGSIEQRVQTLVQLIIT